MKLIVSVHAAIVKGQSQMWLSVGDDDPVNVRNRTAHTFSNSSEMKRLCESLEHNYLKLMIADVFS